MSFRKMKKEGWVIAGILIVASIAILTSLTYDKKATQDNTQQISQETQGIKNETSNPGKAEAVKIEIGKDIEKNCIGFLVGAADEVATAEKISAGWIRPHPGPFAWGFIEKNKGERTEH
jgi:hypothetical protein